MNTEAIIYLARKLGWTRKEIGALTPMQFAEILNEVMFQESVEEYRRQFAIASILAAIYNTIPRKGKKVYKPSDFLKGDMPSRNKQASDIEAMAKTRGIRLPSKELKEREGNGEHSGAS